MRRKNSLLLCNLPLGEKAAEGRVFKYFHKDSINLKDQRVELKDLGGIE